MQYTITAYSTALFSTWINVEELNLLIDAGDGLVSGLMQKSRKVKHAFITHADRDHLNGLPQFVQLNTREDFPKIYYPKNSGSFPALENFLLKFDPHLKGAIWTGIEDGHITEIKKGVEVHAFRNEHIQVPVGTHKSFGYKVFEVKKKLKPEFQELDGAQIKHVVSKHGRDHITEQVKTNTITFSGDTPVDDYSKYDHSKILVHECTFLKQEKNPKLEGRENKHSIAEDVIKMVSEINVEKVILNHFSTRYKNHEINAEILNLLEKYKIDIPVYIIYPGEVKRDILGSDPFNA